MIDIKLMQVTFSMYLVFSIIGYLTLKLTEKWENDNPMWKDWQNQHIDYIKSCNSNGKTIKYIDDDTKVVSTVESERVWCEYHKYYLLEKCPICMDKEM